MDEEQLDRLRLDWLEENMTRLNDVYWRQQNCPDHETVRQSIDYFMPVNWRPKEEGF